VAASQSEFTLRNAMDSWTLVEAMDNKLGQRFNKA
jgi:hypothetical protein